MYPRFQAGKSVLGMACFFDHDISTFLECFRAQFCCVRTQLIDLHQKKYGFYAKVGHNPLQIWKNVVPLHRQKEQTGEQPIQMTRDLQ